MKSQKYKLLHIEIKLSKMLYIKKNKCKLIYQRKQARAWAFASKLCGLLFLMYMYALSASAQINEKMFVENYSPQQYRAAIQNWAIVQDLRGILYIANDRGVLEYDGQKWILIQTSNQSAVRSLSMDKEGRVYVGGSDEFGVLVPNERGETEYLSLIENIPDEQKKFGDVWTTQVTSQGVCFQTDQYLFLYHPERNIFTVIPAFEESYFFLTFWIQDKLYVFDQEYGLYQLESGLLKLVRGGKQLKGKRIYAMISHQEDAFLLGTYQSGLLRYSPNAENQDSLIVPFKTEADRYIIEKQLYSATELPSGEIALCTRAGGVVIISKDGKLHEIIDQGQGIADNNVHYAFVSREGILWLALDNGISKVDYFSPIRFWNETHGLRGTIKDVCFFNKTLYVATSLGVFYRKNHQFYPIQGISTQAWSLLDFKPKEGKNFLLVGSNQGVFKIEGDVAFPVYLTKRTAALKLYESPSQQGILYVGLKGGLARMRHGKNGWIDIEQISPIKSEIYSIAEEKPGVLWLGTFIEGVIRAELNPNYALAKLKNFGLAEGLPSLRGCQVYRIQDKIYVGTAKGLYAFSSSKQMLKPTQDFSKNLAFENYGIHSLVVDAQQNVWVADTDNQSQYIGVARRQGNQRYQWEDHLLRSLPEFNEIILHVDSTLQTWIGGSEGLFRYKAQDTLHFKSDFKVLIRKITLKEDSLIFGGSFYDKLDRIPVASQAQTKSIKHIFEYADNNSIEFYVSAPFFRKSDATEYRYRLEERNPTWVEWLLTGTKTPQWSVWTKETKRQYTNLREGTYVFYAQARNIEGLSSEVIAFRFEISPPWYRSLLAYIAYIILGLLAVGGGVRFYTMRLRRQKRQLEQVILARTLEISQKNEVLSNQQAEILQQAEDLRQANVAILEQSQELVHQNQEITSSINYARRIQESMLPQMAEIQRAFPESFIIYEPRDIVSGDFYWFVETPLEPRYTKEPNLSGTPSIFRGFAKGKKIIAAVDCTGHGVPGAFMSMLGDAYLSQIINSEGITQPQLILKELDNYVKSGLKQKETANLDGMDMTICVIDPNLHTLSFAGAKNPLIYIQDGELHHIRGDKVGIGGFVFDDREEKEFTRHVISLDKPTWFYLFSDGYQDQFGGERGKKFMIKHLKELLLEHHQKPMQEQSLLLKEAIVEWMRGYQQVDDILIFGAYLDPDNL